MRQNYALSTTVEHFRFKSHIYKILNLLIVHQNFLVLKDLSALVLIFIILKLVSNWIWAPRWAVCGAEWFGWAFIGCRCCIKYDRAPPSLLTLINSTVWSLYSLSHGSQNYFLEYEIELNLVLESQLFTWLCRLSNSSGCSAVSVEKAGALHDILQESWISAQWRLPRTV